MPIAPQSSETNSARLPALDGLRGLCALSVVMAHYTPAVLPMINASGSPYLFDFLHTFSVANLSVVFFFGLSAFLLGWLAEQNAGSRRGFSGGRFFLRRLARIGPLYWTVILVSLLVISDRGWISNFSPDVAGTRSYTISHVWQYLLFVYNYAGALVGFNDYKAPYLNEFGHLWSLSVEIQFYLFFSLGFAWFRLLKTGALRFALFCTAAGFVIRLLFIGACGALSRTHPAGLLYFFSFSYVEVFMLSAAAGVTFARHGPSPAWFAWMRRRASAIILAGGLVLLGWSWKFFLWNPPVSAGTGEIALFYAVESAFFSITGIVISATLLWVVANPAHRIQGFFRLPLLQALGTLSYGIYMWHLPVKFLLVPLDVRLVAPLAGSTRLWGIGLMFLVYLGAVIGLSGLTYYGVEQVVNTMRRRWDGKTSGPLSASKSPSPHWLLALAASVAGLSLAVLHGLGAH